MHKQMTPLSEETVRANASILGAQSAAAQALADAERRRAAGERVEFFKIGRTLVVRGTPATD